MKIQLSSIFAIALILVSCNKAQNTSDAHIGTDTQEISSETLTNPTTDTNLVVEQSANTVNNNQPPSINNSSLALNPPHGQPGHRCDIPVGASLDTPPTQTMEVAPSTSTQKEITIDPNNNQEVKQTINSIPVQAPEKTLPSGSLNPPHGQPGHRCDVQVGQPLP